MHALKKQLIFVSKLKQRSNCNLLWVNQLNFDGSCIIVVFILSDSSV